MTRINFSILAIWFSRWFSIVYFCVIGFVLMCDVLLCMIDDFECVDFVFLCLFVMFEYDGG